MIFKKKQKPNSLEGFDTEEIMDTETENTPTESESVAKVKKDRQADSPFKRKRTITSRTMIGLICIISSAVLVFGGSMFNELVFNSQTQIYRAKNPIPRGTIITQDMLDVVTVGALGLNDATLIVGGLSPVGMLADTDIKKGDNLTTYNIAPKLSAIHPELESLNADEVAMTIRLGNSAATLGQRLQAGDVVSILNMSSYSHNERYEKRQRNLYNNLSGGKVESEEKEKDQEVANTPTTEGNHTPAGNEISENETIYIARDPFLQYVEVLYVDKPITQSIDKSSVEDVGVNVTLRVSQEQLESLSSVQSSGGGHIVFITRDTKRKAELLAEQKNFIDSYIKERR